MKNKNCAVLDVADRAVTAVEEMGGDASDLRHELAFAIADTCVCCGAPVPEGRVVCPSCERGTEK